MQSWCYKGLQEYLDCNGCFKAITTVDWGDNVLQIVFLLTVFFCKPINFFTNKYFRSSMISLYKNEVYLKE